MRVFYQNPLGHPAATNRHASRQSRNAWLYSHPAISRSRWRMRRLIPASAADPGIPVTAPFGRKNRRQPAGLRRFPGWGAEQRPFILKVVTIKARQFGNLRMQADYVRGVGGYSPHGATPGRLRPDRDARISPGGYFGRPQALAQSDWFLPGLPGVKTFGPGDARLRKPPITKRAQAIRPRQWGPAPGKGGTWGSTKRWEHHRPAHPGPPATSPMVRFTIFASSATTSTRQLRISDPAKVTGDGWDAAIHADKQTSSFPSPSINRIRRGVPPQGSGTSPHRFTTEAGMGPSRSVHHRRVYRPGPCGGYTAVGKGRATAVRGSISSVRPAGHLAITKKWWFDDKAEFWAVIQICSRHPRNVGASTHVLQRVFGRSPGPRLQQNAVFGRPGREFGAPGVERRARLR